MLQVDVAKTPDSKSQTGGLSQETGSDQKYRSVFLKVHRKKPNKKTLVDGGSA